MGNIYKSAFTPPSFPSSSLMSYFNCLFAAITNYSLSHCRYTTFVYKYPTFPT